MMANETDYYNVSDDDMYSQNVTGGMPPMRLNVTYAVCEVLVAIAAVVGNALVMLVFRRERRLRRRTNYYIVSLAAADFLVGLLGIPFAIMASVGLPSDLYACLFNLSLLVVLCTISIFCLVAVSVDRYWAILHPMGYSRNVRTKTAIGIIGMCWVAGSLVGFLPLFGWHMPAEGVCLFTKVMDYNYLVFLYFATIVFPAVLLAGFYLHIYQVVLKQRRGRAGGSLRVPPAPAGAASTAAAMASSMGEGTRSRRLLLQLRRILTMNPLRRAGGGGAAGVPGDGTLGPAPRTGSGGGTMLRMLGPIKKSEVKATQNLSIIVLFFILCWFPLYTINCIQAFRRDWVVNGTLMEFCIVLSHLNSAGNPLLYAYHLRDFRAALKSFLWKLLGVKEDCPRAGDGFGGGVRSLGSLAQGYVVRGGGGAIGVVGGGGAWAGSGGAIAIHRSDASFNHLLLVPPASATPATAHSSMTSIASSVASAHPAAAAPVLPALALDLPHKVEECRVKMSTVAEASQSEEEHSTTPGSIGPDISVAAAATDMSPYHSPSPPPLTLEMGLAQLGPAVCDAVAAVAAVSGHQLELGELSDGDDDVFIPASAPNADVISLWPPSHGGSGSATENRQLRIWASPKYMRRYISSLPQPLETPSAHRASTSAPDNYADTAENSDDLSQLSPSAAHATLVNGNSNDRWRGTPTDVGGAPAAECGTEKTTTSGTTSRRLSPLKAMMGSFLRSNERPLEESAATTRERREEPEASHVTRNSNGAAKHHNGSLVQRESPRDTAS